ncbi:MAG TPA: hypothetical protein VFL97_10315 [Nitrococcus sp.]|nr:hypothetical protein [Nitrococcus sp.]
MSYEVVVASSPNTIEYGPVDFRADNVNIASAMVSLDLPFHSGFLNATFPAGQFAPSNAA